MSLEIVKTGVKYLIMAYGSWKVITDVVRYALRKKPGRDGGKKEKTIEELQMIVDQRKPPELWNRAFFFPDYIPEEPNSVSSQIVKLIDSARVSIQVCLYLLSFNPFETALLRRYKEGLIIQVITDHDSMSSHNNHIARWKNKGIPIRMKSTGYLMHNKFVIIDDEALLTGSLNWTVQGVTGNRENVLITTDVRLVRAYRQEFKKMWNEFTDV